MDICATARAEGHAAGVAAERARWREAVEEHLEYQRNAEYLDDSRAEYIVDILDAILRACNADGGEARG
jgi:tagatose-1,6-bisphosphate aldolase